MDTNQARRVIAKCGGVSAVMRLLSLPKTTVKSWEDRGFIPAQRQRPLLLAARDAGIPLTADDFFGLDSDAASAAVDASAAPQAA